MEIIIQEYDDVVFRFLLCCTLIKITLCMYMMWYVLDVVYDVVCTRCGMYVDVYDGGMYMLWYVHGVVCIWYGTYYGVVCI